MAKTPTSCPRCGSPPAQLQRVREPVTSGFGPPPDPQIVEKATCHRGDGGYGGDEPEAGDVVIHRKAGMSICSYGLVQDDSTLPADWKTGTLEEAKEFATRWTAETGGRKREYDV